MYRKYGHVSFIMKYKTIPESSHSADTWPVHPRPENAKYGITNGIKILLKKMLRIG
jgi:hypothetical protein